MAYSNEELMQKLVRTSMIMRHIDGESFGKCGHKHHHGRRHGRCCEGHHGHHGDAMDVEAAQAQADPHTEGAAGHPHGHHGHHKHRHGQLRVISMVAMQEGISQKDLAYLLGIRPQTLGEMLQKLEGYGIVERKKSESDGRVTQVYLTDAGRTHAEEIAEMRKVVAADIFAVLTDDEKEQLSTILDKLDAELDRRKPKHHGSAEQE